MYTFPANDPSATVWVERECSRLPLATRLLRAIPGVRTALFSRLGPGTRLAPHRGWASLANHVLRCHLVRAVEEMGLVLRPQHGAWKEDLLVAKRARRTHKALARE